MHACNVLSYDLLTQLSDQKNRLKSPKKQ